MRRLLTSAAAMLAVALLSPVSPAQVRRIQGPDSHATRSKSAIVPARPLGHAGVLPTPMGVSPPPARAFPAPTPIGVPPMLPAQTTPNGSRRGFHHQHHRGDFLGGAYPVYVPVPVVVDPSSMYPATPDQADQEEDDQAVVAGPTVFERRTPDDLAADRSGPEPAAAQPPSRSPEVAAPPADSGSSTQPAQAQEPSVLILRDGHQLEVQNYAIVGDVLYDFTPGHARRVPLSQLDLPATVKANDDRGVDFTLPASARGE
jgi:hypothetical protein